MFKETNSKHMGDTVSTIAYDPQTGRFAVGLLDERVLLLDKSLEPIHTLRAGLGAVDATFNNSGTELAFTCMDYTLKVVNVNAKAEKTNIECNPMEAWKLRYWKNNIITGGDQGKIFVYEAENGNLVSDYRFSDSYISSIAVSGKNDVVFGNSKGELGYFTEQSVQSIGTKHKKYIRAMSFFSDASKLVICSDDLMISVMDIQSGKTVQTFTGHMNLMNAVDTHPTDPIFVTGSSDRTVKVWDLRQSGAVDTPQNTSNSPIWSLKFANRGKEVLIGSEIGMISLLTAQSGEFSKLINFSDCGLFTSGGLRFMWQLRSESS